MSRTHRINLSEAPPPVRSNPREVLRLARGYPIRPAEEEEIGALRAKIRAAVDELLRRNEELKAAQDEIEEERWRYRAFFDLVSDGYLITDARGVIWDANQSAARRLGTPAGLSLPDLVPAEDRAEFNARLSQLDRFDPGPEWRARLRALSGDLSVKIVGLRRERGRIVTLLWQLEEADQIETAGLQPLRPSTAARSANALALSDLTENRILAALPRPAIEALAAELEPVDLKCGQVLQEPGEPIRHVYFPRRAMISLISLMRDGEGGEVGVVGREGLLGINVILGDRISPIQATVQIPGPALRLPAEAFQTRCREHEPLHALIGRYIQALFVQIAQSAACNGHHQIEARLRRWLLMARDCVQTDALPLTHEFLARMLGVRRSGITVAAQSLQQEGLIRYRRGHLRIIDRAGLEATACECYRLVRDEFNRLLDRR
jgi:CRP-like cAMP-binding protein